MLLCGSFTICVSVVVVVVDIFYVVDVGVYCGCCVADVDVVINGDVKCCVVRCITCAVVVDRCCSRRVVVVVVYANYVVVGCVYVYVVDCVVVVCVCVGVVAVVVVVQCVDIGDDVVCCYLCCIVNRWCADVVLLLFWLVCSCCYLCCFCCYSCTWYCRVTIICVVRGGVVIIFVVVRHVRVTVDVVECIFSSCYCTVITNTVILTLPVFMFVCCCCLYMLCC